MIRPEGYVSSWDASRAFDTVVSGATAPLGPAALLDACGHAIGIQFPDFVASCPAEEYECEPGEYGYRFHLSADVRLDLWQTANIRQGSTFLGMPGFAKRVMIDKKAKVPAQRTVRLQLVLPPVVQVLPQGELTPGEIADGAVRPDHIVNSLALYGPYGKVGHILRPKMWDSAGTPLEAWCDLSYSDGVMVVTLDEDFVQNAEYPIYIDPTFGYETVGGTGVAWNVANAYWSASASPGSSGNLTHIGWYNPTGDSTARRFAVYTDSSGPDAVVDTTAEDTDATTGWVDVAVSVGAAVSSGSTYWICVINDGGLDYRYDYSSGSLKIKANTYASGFPDPASPSSSDNRIATMRATYTESGGGRSTYNTRSNPLGQHIGMGWRTVTL